MSVTSSNILQAIASASNEPPVGPVEVPSTGSIGSEPNAPSTPFAASRRRLDEACSQPADQDDATAVLSETSPTSNVWDFQHEKRCQQDAKSRRDVGFQRPTMDQLRPIVDLLATNAATGNALLDAYEAYGQDSSRPVVGYVKIATGAHTLSMDEGKALKAMLFDNHDTEPLPGLADIVQVRKDLANQQLILGVASYG
ncbi:hypothetical protein AC1031_012447 [Aphanomyces cochlioides]|nr:hypothetical protein AC1031_012447 [Aphanomyces cochlioides]